MKILVAEANLETRWWLQAELMGQGEEVLAVGDGPPAWEVLVSADLPQVVLLDRALPGLDGLELCHKIRGTPLREQPYVILLLDGGLRGDGGRALQAGADDYLRRPLDPDELAARIGVAHRVMRLQAQATASTEYLCNSVLDQGQLTHPEVVHPHNLLPMCAWCKRVRSGEEDWQQLEKYLANRLETEVSHGICPECMGEMLTALPAQAGAVPSLHHRRAF